MASNIILIFHVIFAIAIVVLVLIQHGKGADMGAAFGSGSAGSLFGSAGASNFLSKSTAGFAALFFATSLALTYFHAPKSSSGVMGDSKPKVTEPAKKSDTIPTPGGIGIPVPTTGAPAIPVVPAAGSPATGTPVVGTSTTGTAAPAVAVPVPAPASTPVPAPAETKSDSKSQQIPK
jgi:preprotein translocase subunit SecG